MASHGVGESTSGPSNHLHLPNYSLFHGFNHYPSPIFSNQERSSVFAFGELEQAIGLQGDGVNDRTTFLGGISSASTSLKMSPSWPMGSIHHTPTVNQEQVNFEGSSKSGEESTEEAGSAANTLTSRAHHDHGAHLLESESPMSNDKRAASSSSDHDHHQVFDHNLHDLTVDMASDAHVSILELSPHQSAVGPSQPKVNHSHYNTTPKRRGAGSATKKQVDAKTLRRLAQNREAAKKSRLRKKAYVQQLESSRSRLSQLEQDLQRARSQGLLLGAFGTAAGNISSGGAIFDMEYARWLEDEKGHMVELRSALQACLSDDDLRQIVDNYVSHYDKIFRLKSTAAKSDVFHLITGMWVTPAERCFLWMAGFKPSDLIKMLITQVDPLTEQQVMEICKLERSVEQAEDALSQGQDQVQQSLIETIAASPPIITDDINQMAMTMAINRLSNLEAFVHQADVLRQQTLHQLRRILTVRQATKYFLVIGEYYNRLRALSTLWTSRPGEALIKHDHNLCQQTTSELQVIHQNSQTHFSNL